MESKSNRVWVFLAIVALTVAIVGALHSWVVEEPTTLNQCGPQDHITTFEGSTSGESDLFYCPGRCMVFWNATVENPDGYAGFTLYLYNTSKHILATHGGLTNSWEINFKGYHYFDTNTHNIAAWRIDIYECSEDG